VSGNMTGSGICVFTLGGFLNIITVSKSAEHRKLFSYKINQDVIHSRKGWWYHGVSSPWAWKWLDV